MRVFSDTTSIAQYPRILKKEALGFFFRSSPASLSGPWHWLAPRLRRNAALPGTRGRGPSSLTSKSFQPTASIDWAFATLGTRSHNFGPFMVGVAFSATYSWELLAPAFRSVPFVSHGNCRSIPWDLTLNFQSLLYWPRKQPTAGGPLSSQPLLSVPYFRALVLIR